MRPRDPRVKPRDIGRDFAGLKGREEEQRGGNLNQVTGSVQPQPAQPKPGMWYDDPTKLESNRQQFLQNRGSASGLGMDPKIANNPKLFGSFMKEYNRRVSQAMQGQTMPQNAEASAAMMAQMKADVGRKLSTELLQGSLKDDRSGIGGLVDSMDIKTPGGSQDIANIMQQFGDGVPMPMETYNSILNGGMLNDHQKWWFQQNRQAILSGKIPGAQLEQAAGAAPPAGAAMQEGGKGGPDLSASTDPNQPTTQTGQPELPAQDDGTVPATLDHIRVDEPTVDEPVDPYQAYQDYRNGTGEWDNTFAGQQGFREENQWAGELNNQAALMAMAEQYAKDGVGFRGEWNSLGRNSRLVPGTGHNGVEYYWPSEDGGGGWYTQQEVMEKVKQSHDRTQTQAQQDQRQNDFMEDLQNWADDHQYGNDPLVDPFGDDEGWGDMVSGLFDDLQGMPESGDLLKSFMDMFPLEDFSPEAMPDATPEERRTAYFDMMKENDIDIAALESGDNEARDAFFEELRERALALDPEKFLKIEDEAYNKIKDTQLGYIIDQLNAQPVSPQLDYKEIEKQLNAQLKPAERQMMKDLQSSMRAHAAAGRGKSSAVGKTVADMQADFHAVRSATASQMIMNAQVKNADLMAQAIQNVEAGKINAIEQLGQMREGDLHAMLEKAGLYGTAVGDTLNFIAQIGNTSVGEAGVDAKNFATRADQHMKVAELELKGQLDIAGMDIEKYRIDRGFDTTLMQTDLEKHFRQQGLNLDAARLKAQQTTSQWEAATAAAGMVQRGETDKLMQMAALALKAEQGDEQAWADYNGMVLQEQLAQRGMDINLSTAVASLVSQQYLQGEEWDFEKWKIMFSQRFEREMIQLGLDAGEEAGWMDILGDFIGGGASIGAAAAGAPGAA